MLNSFEVLERVSHAIGHTAMTDLLHTNPPTDTPENCIIYLSAYFRGILCSSKTDTVVERSMLDPNSRPYEWCNNFIRIVAPTVVEILNDEH